MRILLIFLFTCVISSLNAQTKNDTIFYTADWKRTIEKNNFKYYGFKDLDSTAKGIATYYYLDHQIYCITPVLDTFIYDGMCIWYHPNGKKRKEGTYYHNLRIGKFQYWDSNGNLTTIRTYQNDTIIQRDEFNIESGELANTIVGRDNFPTIEAMFHGGAPALQIWISQSVVYPQESIKYHDEGKVMVSFVIEMDGSISNVNIVKSVCKSLDNEALRLVRSMPKWIPATFEGEFIRSRHQIPINFTLGPDKRFNKVKRE